MANFGCIVFCKYGGWGWSELFQTAKCTFFLPYELVVFPLRGPGKPPERNSPKNCTILLPCPAPEIREKLQKNYKNWPFGVVLSFFGGGAIFLLFSGSDRGEECCSFSPFFEEFPPRRLSSPSKGKNNSQWHCPPEGGPS